jgi:Tfp pilus assembly protein PilN
MKIGIEPIGEQFILAYAAAFQLALFHQLTPLSISIERVDHNLEEFGEKQKFSFRLATIAIAFFVLLLINFLLFSYYGDKNSSLSAQVSQSSASMETSQQTESEILKKEQLLKEIGWNKGKSYAWLADQLGQTVPASIELTEMSINPLDATVSNRLRKQVYQSGVIKVAGVTPELTSINDWVYVLKGKPWVKQVRLDNFSPSQEENRQQFSFTIILD